MLSYTESEQHTGGVSLDVMADYLGVTEKELLRETQLDQAQNEIYDWLHANEIANGGTYVNQYGEIVVLLEHKSSEVENYINTLSGSQINVEFKYVKYSKDELKSFQKKLVTLAEKYDIGIFGVGIDTKSNKLNVDIKPEAYEKYKDFILEHIDDDLLDWNPNNLSLINYSVSPGDGIHNYVDNCSTAFHAIMNSTEHTVTAGHCDEGLPGGTWYHEDTNDSLGHMVYLDYGSGSRIDAGLVKLGGASVDVHVNNTPDLTIGTIDINGAGHQQGKRIFYSSRSGNSTAIVESDSYSIVGAEHDVVITTKSGRNPGDSGGLAFRLYQNSAGDYYAVIEGVFKGITCSEPKDSQGNCNGEEYEVFSKAANVYDDLFISSIINDPSFTY